MKSKEFDHKEWFRKANENLESVRSLRKNKNISNEKICIEAHEAVEFAIKGLMVYLKIPFPKTHSIRILTDLIQEKEFKIPVEILESQRLTYYTSDTKYPGDYDEVSKAEMKEVASLAKKVVKWAEKIIKDKNTLFK